MISRRPTRLAGLGAVVHLALGGPPLGSAEHALAEPGAPPRASAARRAATHTLEIRAYNLEPGTRGRFHELVVTEALPMLARWDIDVVAFGPSPHDEDSYFLIRRFPSVAERERIEEAFYGSAEWRSGPREAILECIESYTTIVLEVDEATLGGLRAAGVATAAPPTRDGG